MPTLLWSAAGVGALALLLGTAPAEAQAPIKIGASLSLTGTYAKPGTYQKEGYEVCADELNAKASSHPSPPPPRSSGKGANTSSW